jgi:ribosomal protein S12 methylthiotransferase accessory factor
MQPSVPTHPAAFGHWLVRGGTLACRLPHKTVHVTAPPALLAAVARLCDGRLAWRDVAAQLAQRWDAGQVGAFLAGLSHEGVLVQAGQQVAHWAAPAAFEPAAGGTFDDLPLAADVLHAVAGAVLAGEAGEGCGPSAPSPVGRHRWFLLVLRTAAGGQTSALAPGLHAVGRGSTGGCKFELLSTDTVVAWSLLPDPRVLQFASAVLLQAVQLAPGDGDGAALQAFVQAGMALRDAQSAASARGAAAVVRHDIDAPAVRDLLAPHVGHELLLPVPPLVLGARPMPVQLDQQRSEAWIQLQPSRAPPSAGRRRHGWIAGPFPTAAGELLAAGRADDPALAVLKAEAEAWERLGWATPAPGSSRARMADVPGALDPATLVAYSAAQHRRPQFPFHRFDPHADYLWLPGHAVMTARVVHVAADLVHAYAALPPESQQRALTACSTSGMAAGTGIEQALERATLELVERHAFLLSWIEGVSLPGIDTRTLPAALRMRVQALAEGGTTVRVLRLPCGLAPVFAVFVQRQQPALTGITAAADFDPDSALHKALDEAESRLQPQRAAPPGAKGRQAGVHALDRLWRLPHRFRRADWYAAAPAVESFSRPASSACGDWPALLARLRQQGHDVFAVDVTPPGSSVRQGRTPLHVVRSLVPGLLPIWFEQGLEPAGLPAYRQARSGAGGVHRGRPLPIHPFT